MPPAVPISPMMARMMSLAVTPCRQLAVDHRAHVLRLRLDQRLRRQHVLDLRGADAVGERAERAVGRGVAVAAHERGAGQREALLGADDVDDALPLVELVVIFEPEELGVLGQIGDLRRALRIGIGLAAVGGRHVVVDHQQRLLGRAHLAAGQPQSLERLRARHLVHEMAVDVDQAGAVGLLVDQVVVPDLVVEGARLGHRARPVGCCVGLYLVSCRARRKSARVWRMPWLRRVSPGTRPRSCGPGVEAAGDVLGLARR